jgi:hypothetical protein
VQSRRVAIAISLLIGLIASGCGKVDLTTVDPAGSAPSRTTGNPAVKAPIVVAPTPAPAPTYNPPLPMGKLMANLKFEDDPIYTFGLGTKKAIVDVSNPTTVPLRGSLKVEFTKKGTPVTSKPAETREVALDPGGKEQITFTISGTSGFGVDNAKVTVQMEGETAGGAAGQVPNVPAPGAQTGQTGAASVYGTPPSGYNR